MLRCDDTTGGYYLGMPGRKLKGEMGETAERQRAAEGTEISEPADDLRHMREDGRLDILRRSVPFSRLADEHQRTLASIGELQRFEAGARVVAEGSEARALYIVVAGEVEVTRRLTDASEGGQIRRLGAGESFGELALLDDLPVSASVSAVAPATLLALPLPELRRLIAGEAFFGAVHEAIARQLSARLRSLTDTTVGALEREVHALRARVVVGTLLIALVAILSAFTFSLGLQAQLARAGLRQLVVFVICLSGLVAVGITMRLSRLPMSFFGFTTRSWRGAVREAIVASVTLIASLVAVKSLLISVADGWRAVPLLHLVALIDSGDPTAVRAHFVQLALYVLAVVPLQEILIRGCLQGSLEEFLVGRHRVILAVATSNLVFSVTHSYFSPHFALLTLLPGLVWGWLYHRQRTLIGPILSHALVGVAAMDIIGIVELYR
jgi:CRP-like cAMP-binding protein